MDGRTWRPSWANVCQWLLTGLIALCIVGMVASRYGWVQQFPFTMTASAAFVLLAIACGGLGTSYGRLVLAALLCCAAGDVIGPRNFLAGVAAFLVAHLFLILAFVVRGMSRSRLLAGFVVAAISTLAILVWLFPHVPSSERVLVFAYVCVISAMAVAAGGTSARPAGRLVLIAAIVFFVSDIFVARWKYVGHDSINSLICYPLYYAACTGFAWSVYLVSIRAQRNDQETSPREGETPVEPQRA